MTTTKNITRIDYVEIEDDNTGAWPCHVIPTPRAGEHLDAFCRRVAATIEASVQADDFYDDPEKWADVNVRYTVYDDSGGVLCEGAVVVDIVYEDDEPEDDETN